MCTPPTDALDRDDMEQLAAGHDAALDRLMDRHALRVLHYLTRLVQSETEAQDLTQETFVRVYQHRSRFSPRYRFVTWLYTIATNLARDVLRRRRRRPALSLDEPAGSLSPALRDTLPCPDASPGQSLLNHESAAMVRQAIAALSEDLRVPLLLAEYEDLSYAEIATTLGCTPKAVEMRLYRARQELRQRLAPLLA